MCNKPPFTSVKRKNLTNRREYDIYYKAAHVAKIIDFKESKIKALYVDRWAIEFLDLAVWTYVPIRTNGDGLNVAYGIVGMLNRRDPYKDIDVASVYPRIYTD